jgi:hypothetical protein
MTPPPWRLTGHGYILVYRFPPEFVPPDMRDRFRGGLGTVMLVDYQTSNVGAYRELLFIPGLFAAKNTSTQSAAFSITRIYVSTMASVEWGRRNWGIPKEHAEFDIQRKDDRETIRLVQNDIMKAQFFFSSSRLQIPVTTAIIPASLRMLVQTLDGRTFATAPGGHGAISPAKLDHAEIDPSFFPDISKLRPLITLKARGFVLNFPVPKVEPAYEH